MSADSARKSRKRTSSEASFGSEVGDGSDGAVRKRKKYAPSVQAFETRLDKAWNDQPLKFNYKEDLML